MSLQLWILPPIVAFAAPTYFIPSSFSSFYSIRWLTRLILSWIAELLTPKQTEVTTAQADFTDKISSLVQTFFPPSSQSFPAGKALSWISAILAIVFGIGAFLDPTPEGKALSAGIAAAGGLINAGVTMDVNNLQPNPASPLNTIQDMQNYCQNISQGMRNTIATWANTTFLGGEDANHQTIL